MGERAFLYLTAAFLAFAPVQAQSQTNAYEAQIQAQIDLVEGLMESQGYRLLGVGAIEPIEEGGISSTAFHVIKGRDYIFAAVCDTDCDDVDLEVYDSAEELLGSDNDDTDAALVPLTATKDASLSARVTLFNCETGACYYGVALFGK